MGMTLYLEALFEISEASGGGTKTRQEWRKMP
jgi:hypothetical protein